MELISIRQAINLLSISTSSTSTQWERLKEPKSRSLHWREEQIYDPWVACLNQASSALQSTIIESSTTQTLCFLLASRERRKTETSGYNSFPFVLHGLPRSQWWTGKRSDDRGSLTEPIAIIYCNRRELDLTFSE